jgi:hypothetical protein
MNAFRAGAGPAGGGAANYAVYSGVITVQTGSLYDDPDDIGLKRRFGFYGFRFAACRSRLLRGPLVRGGRDGRWRHAMGLRISYN